MDNFLRNFEGWGLTEVAYVYKKSVAICIFLKVKIIVGTTPSTRVIVKLILLYFIH